MEARDEYVILVKEPFAKQPLERPRKTLEGCIKMEHKQTGCEVEKWLELVQDRGQLCALVGP
jgi:hypothetical protein